MSTFARAEISRLYRYALVGLATNLSLFLIFLLMLRLAWPPTLAAAVCYVLGVAFSYVINRRWTFASSESHVRDLSKFLLAYGIGLANTVLSISLLLNWLPPEPAQIINIVVTALVIYACLRVLRFGESGAKHAD